MLLDRLLNRTRIVPEDNRCLLARKIYGFHEETNMQDQYRAAYRDCNPGGELRVGG